ncbi:MAG: PilZ domain-containing protein [Pseudobacteriovorax sp.]|nr:PilZ domain-containing protein [Pseudobacteriovorax sp.]
MTLVNLDKSLGPLRTQGSRDLIAYEAFEFSRSIIGILTGSELAIGTKLSLDSHRNGELLFEVVHSQNTGNLFRHRLICRTLNLDLADILDIDPNNGKIRYERRENRLQYARFGPVQKIIVQTKTFGAISYYHLETVDISRTGLLLSAPAHSCYIPFIEQTLLELKVDLSGEISQIPLEPLAKVVRRYTKGVGAHSRRYYGVKFVEFSQDDMQAWRDVIAGIEESCLDHSVTPVAA